jgi:hypothetical protein
MGEWSISKGSDNTIEEKREIRWKVWLKVESGWG